jgi:hypothetical protein
VLVEVVRLRGGSPSANSFWCNLSHYTLDAALEPRLYIGSLCSNIIKIISKGVVKMAEIRTFCIDGILWDASYEDVKAISEGDEDAMTLWESGIINYDKSNRILH